MSHFSLQYSEWVVWLFDRSVPRESWPFLEELLHRSWPGDSLVQFVEKLFNNADVELLPFNEYQIASGLWFMASPSGDYLSLLLDESIPWKYRRNAIRSIYTLYSKFYQVKCQQFMSHSRYRLDSPINSVCFMWWELFPRFAHKNNNRFEDVDREILSVMSQTLRLRNIACRESALHGLGHWREHYPSEVTLIIEEYMTSNGEISLEEQEYAIDASRGRVL